MMDPDFEPMSKNEREAAIESFAEHIALEDLLIALERKAKRMGLLVHFTFSSTGVDTQGK